MKNKILILLTVFMGSILLNACYEETSLFHTPEEGDDQYTQLVFGDQSFVMDKLDSNGEPTNLVTAIDVKVLGAAPTSDITVDYDIILTELGDDYTPATAAMFTLSARSITIPAGSSNGVIDLTFLNLELPLEEAVSFKIKLKDGSLPTYAINNEAIYTIFKKDFCPILDIENFAGTWIGEDAFYASAITSVSNGDNIDITDLGQGILVDWWGEPFIAGGTATLLIHGDGTISIEDGDYVTTEWDGAPYDYAIRNFSGTWTNCSDYPVLEFTYDLHNTTDNYSLAAQAGVELFYGLITLDPAGPAKSINKSLKKLTELNTVKKALK